VDELRLRKRADVVTLEQRQLLQGCRPLPPGRRLAHGQAAVEHGCGRLQRRAPARQIVARQEPVLLAREPIDLLRHEAFVVDAARALDRPARLVEQPPPRRCQPRVAEERPRPRCRQVQLRRRRPGAEQRLDAVDRRGDRGHHRVPALGVGDRVLEDVGERPGAELLEQEQPAAERPRDARGEDAGTGDEHVAERPEALDRRRRRGDALRAEHQRLAAPGRPEDDRQVAAGAVHVGLHHLQDEARGADRVEGVPAALEHRHAGLRGEPVSRRDRAERAAQLGACRDAQVRAQSAPT
jgi:hypothetical protein